MAAETTGLLVWQTEAVSLAIIRWVDREAEGSLFPHGEGDLRTGNCAGEWDSASALVGLEEGITHFRDHIKTTPKLERQSFRQRLGTDPLLVM